MANPLLSIVESTVYDAATISAHVGQIRAALLGASGHIDKPNFDRISSVDLELLFAEYDRRFFAGKIVESLGPRRLTFGLSKLMTSSGGKTAWKIDRTTGQRWYEISVSTAILFSCFRGDDHRPIATSGIPCRDRLDALLRIFEHELVHLIEMQLWDKSSCSRARFHALTLRFFGHTENTHRLITPRERSIEKFGIKPGMTVRFRFDGIEHVGVVNRVNKRATILVENRTGARYSNGKRYLKFYIPMPMLAPVG